MLEGLEISIIKKSEIFENRIDKSSRFDAEFFSKEYLANNLLIESKKNDLLVNLTNSIDVGFVGSMVNEYTDGGILLLQTNNIDEFHINSTNKVYVNITFHEKLKKSQIFTGDILIARSGSFGKASIYQNKETINSSDIIIVRANEDKINKFFLTAFLNSNLGKKQLFRFASGGLQGHVNLTILENLIVPILNNELQKIIEKLVVNSFEKLESSESKYSQSNTTLLSELNLSNWKPSAKNIAVKKLSNSFDLTGRFDAEYYQPKYDELTKKINGVKHDTLGNLADFKKSIEPGSDVYQTEGIPFIRVSDISKFGLSDPEIHLDRSLFDIDELKPKKDTILLSKDGSVGIAYKVEADQDIITSSALLHLKLKTKEVLPDYLTLVLNSKLTQMQAERDAGGSIIQHWRPDEIKQVLIPILPMDVQKELSKQIQQSFKLRKESKRLLEVAKNAVEIAIEEGEAKAMKYIKENS